MIIRPALDPERPLADGREESGRAQALGDVVVEAEPFQAGLRQDHAVKFAGQGLVEAGFDVPADVDHDRSGRR